MSLSHTDTHTHFTAGVIYISPVQLTVDNARNVTVPIVATSTLTGNDSVLSYDVQLAPEFVTLDGDVLTVYSGASSGMYFVVVGWQNL